MHSPISKLDGWFVGEDQTFEWTVYEDDDMTLQDLTNWLMEFRLARASGQASVLTKAVSLTDPGNGVCSVFVSATESGALPAFDYYYQLWRTNTGFKDVVAEGKAALRARVP